MAAALISTAYFIFDNYWVTAIGMGLVVYSFIQYVESLGRKMAIIEMISVIASFQWILGPYIAYQLGNIHYKYRMYVDEQTYMNFVVPSLIAFLIGLHLFKSKYSFHEILANFHSKFTIKRHHVYLIIMGSILVGMFVNYVPSVLRFFVFFVVQLKYIGVLYLLMTRDRYRWPALFLVMTITLMGSLQYGLFHNLILWSAFIFSFLCIEYKLGRFVKYVIIGFGMISIVAIQDVKSDYREIIEQGYTGSKIVLFLELVFTDEYILEEEPIHQKIDRLNHRMNQGWIISAIMVHVPQYRDFAGGETILQAIKDAVLPRFLVEKRKVWAGENFMKYTGLHLSSRTTMGISVVGEAYINYGPLVGTGFMFLWGAIISFIMMVLMNLSISNPSIFLWAPLVFLQVVKAETELVIVLNHAVKAFVFLVVFYWGMTRIFKWKI